MSFNIKVSGTWQELASAWIKVSGTWQQVQSAWVKVSGTWQQVLANWVVSVDGGGHFRNEDPASDAYVGIRWMIDGTVDNYVSVQQDAATDWIIPNSATSEASFVIRFTETGTTGPWAYTGITPDGTTWYALSTQRNVLGHTTSGTVTATCTFTAEISDDGGSTILDSGSYVLTSQLLV